LGLGGSVREQARNMLENCERLDQAKVVDGEVVKFRHS
jgi:hypothetical protein